MKTLEQTSNPAVLKMTDLKIMDTTVDMALETVVSGKMGRARREKRASSNPPALRCVFAALCIIQQIHE
jgi:hypothetical protein